LLILFVYENGDLMILDCKDVRALGAFMFCFVDVTN